MASWRHSYDVLVCLRLRMYPQNFFGTELDLKDVSGSDSTVAPEDLVYEQNCDDKKLQMFRASCILKVVGPTFIASIMRDPATMILLSKTAQGVCVRLINAKTFRDSLEAPKMLWANSVSTAYLIYRIPYVPIGLRILEEEWRGKDTSLAHLKLLRMKCETAFMIRRSPGDPRQENITIWKNQMKKNLKTEHAPRMEPPDPHVQRSTNYESKALVESKGFQLGKLVRILISEGSLYLLKILRMKSLAAMFTRLVMKEKLKFCAALTSL
ncbi:hypothetical protein Tco_0740223 [Tanacetum coccineum]